MHRLTQGKTIIILLTLTFLLACFTGCSEDTDEDGNGGEALLLPPDDSMTLDLSMFDGGKLEAPVLPSLPGTRLNFAAAKTTALVINTLVVAHLSVPVAVFTAAKSAVPVKQDDDSWLWSYSRTIGVETFTANLTGKRESDQVTWSMKVTNTTSLRPLDGFEWYTGVNSRDNGSGSWQFFNRDTPDQANPTYTIDWKIEGEGKRERTFTNQEAGSPAFGNVVRYAVEGDMASISFTEAAKDSTTIIEWSRSTGAGSITSPEYKQGEKSCWDEDKQDKDCE